MAETELVSYLGWPSPEIINMADDAICHGDIFEPRSALVSEFEMIIHAFILGLVYGSCLVTTSSSRPEYHLTMS